MKQEGAFMRNVYYSSKIETAYLKKEFNPGLTDWTPRKHFIEVFPSWCLFNHESYTVSFLGWFWFALSSVIQDCSFSLYVHIFQLILYTTEN